MSGIFGFFSNKEKSPEEKSPEDIEKEKRYAACEEKFEQCKKIPLDIEVEEKLKPLRGGRRKSKSNRRRKSKSSRRGRKSRRSRK